MDFTKAIQIAENIYWIGMYLENDPFQCHPYLIENGDESILIDPGSMLEFEAVMEKIKQITDLKNIKYIILHHQDPDLCASVPEIEKAINREDLQIVTHSRMTVLIKHYMVTSSYYEIDKNDLKLTTNNGFTLQFLTTPYCHSPGAFVTYEPKTKVLFSGDIFGGLEESWEFYAKDDYFSQAEAFHRNYMPSKDIFNYALRKIEQLDIDLIAPQHGSIIEKTYIDKLIEDMKQLDCGLYIEKKYNEELIDTIARLEKKDKELELLNYALEDRVKEEVEKNRQQQVLMIQQSRLAQMGEMINMIAHQWRQPLNAISAVSISINIKAKIGTLKNEYLIKKTDKIANYSQQLSSTIDNFRNFFKSNRETEEVSLDELVKFALSIIETSIKNRNIELIKDLNCQKKFKTYPNELKQVILNLIKNAEDIMLTKEIKEPFIKISTYEDENNYILEVNDNGGGVPQEIVAKIFDPYFSTKKEKDGTGLGLYMSKTIIEDHCGGKLSLFNNEFGAVFRIIL